MLEYLHERFSNFIYLPILIIDSADQPMEEKSFEEIYPSLIETAKNVGVQIAYAIGVAEPVSVYIETFGTEHQDKTFLEAFVRENYDLTPKGIISGLHLLDVDYNRVSAYGHFGKPGFPWEQ